MAFGGGGYDRVQLLLANPETVPIWAAVARHDAGT